VLSWGKDKPRSTAPLLIGMRDRALVGVMVYAFARINAVLQIKVSDYFAQGPPRLGAPAREPGEYAKYRGKRYAR
jgi:hypothetical protein